MRTFLEKKLGPKDKGFTLIELLVVIVIIGILAAIAIPIFLNQRKKAADAGAKSDVRSVATQLESAFTDNNVYVAPGAVGAGTIGGTVAIGGESVKLSPGDTLEEVMFNTAGTAFCARVTANKGSAPTVGYTWVSDKGGLQNPNPANCAAVAAPVGGTIYTDATP